MHVASEVVSPAGACAFLPGQVKDDGRSFEDELQVGGDKVGLQEGEVGIRARRLKVLLLEPAGVVVAERVDADDRVAVGQEALAKV